MPELGDCVYGRKLGFKSDITYIWASCKICGKERWVQKDNGKPRWNHCRHCGAKYARKIYSGAQHYNWKGGITHNGDGYIVELVNTDSPFWPMAKNRNKQVLQHRLVMARHLGRCLKRGEIVHHLNGIKSDNRIENLILRTLKNHEHNTLNNALKTRVRELEAKLNFWINKALDKKGKEEYTE